MDVRPSDVSRHRSERYVILTLLASSSRPWMPFRTLFLAMDRRGHSLSLDNLQYHIERILEPEDLVAVRRVRDLSAELREGDRRSPADIDAVKLMPRGFTAVNEPEKFDEVERP
ncbi:MAG: hypothetical protein KDC27_19170 [Acidobacteria bacterium]|nr:hypothetical protein [Acidobacteriota bacterium]